MIQLHSLPLSFPIASSDIELFLILGINPGAGSYKHGNIKLHRIEPLDKSEYETEEYDLQNEWITIFGPKERINNIELLYKSVKTNCCFFATENTQKLQKLKSRLLYKYKINISEKEKKWIKTILNYVNPRIIICEGFGAFNSLKNINEKLPVLGFKRIYSRFADIEDTVDTIKDALDGKI